MTPEERSLWAVLEARDRAIARGAEQRASLQAEVDRRAEVIRGLTAKLHEEDAFGKMNALLEEKEAVIHEQSRALESYRAAFSVLGWVMVPMNHLVLGVRCVLRRTIGRFGSRLGVLRQYPPRVLRPPVLPAQIPQPAPRISIVTPSFRQAEFIERTIRSVIEQRYPNLEYFVQDGGSRDGTTEILGRYAPQLSGWASESDSGQSQAINRAFAKTSGEIMAWINSDDILFPNALAQVAEFFALHPEIDVVYGHRVLIDEQDREIGRWILPTHNDGVLTWADYVPQETLFWRRRMWDSVGGLVDESFRFAMDWDLLLRFRDAGARFARMPRFLGGFRVHSRQKTSAGISDVGFAEMNRLRERVLGRVPTRIEISKAVAPYLIRHTATDWGWRIRNSMGMQT